MHFARNLYIGKDFDIKSSEFDSLCRQIKYGFGHPDAYAIYINSTTNKPEFLHCKYLKEKHYLNSPLEIIGICKSYEEALTYLTVDALNNNL